MKKCETKWSRAALGLRAGSDLISFTWRETWLHSAASVKLDRPAAGDQSQWRDDELTSCLFHVNVDLLFDLVLFFSSVATDGTWTVFSMMFWTGSIWFKPEIWFTQLHFNSVARLMCSQRFKYIFWFILNQIISSCFLFHLFSLENWTFENNILLFYISAWINHVSGFSVQLICYSSDL